MEHKSKLLCVALTSVFASSSVFATDYILQSNDEFSFADNTNRGGVFDSVNIQVSNAWVEQNSFVFNIAAGHPLIINGDTSINIVAKNKRGYDSGNYVFQANGGEINLNGNVAVDLRHSPDLKLDEIGANVFYAQDAGKINIGTSGSTTRAWVISAKPDLISAKGEASVVINSINNQLVGNVDMRKSPTGSGTSLIGSMLDILGHQNRVSGKFMGPSSFWFGDEVTYKNSSGSFAGLSADGLLATDASTLDFTFKNGAQWIYLGDKSTFETSSAKLTSRPKRISAITLLDGGIINLYDASVKELMAETGLDQVLSEDLLAVKHDYVRIGDLKGSNGIFRLDLNINEKSESDMIFVESSSDPGLHYIEPYNLSKLEGITPENTLRFATVAKEARITFADKQNIYGESLFDYELEIASEAYNPNDPGNGDYEDRMTADGETSDDFIGGTNWFIQRVIKTQSAASLSMTGIGYAAYDAATAMDTYRDRLQAQSDETNTLWVRYRYGHGGIENQYRRDYNVVSVGANLLRNASLNMGVAFSYSNSDVDLCNTDGTGDLDGYEFMFYNTFTGEKSYLDLTAKFGQMDANFDSVNQIGTNRTKGDFSIRYAGLSAEAGYRFGNPEGYFLEPQVQLQYTYLGSDDYSTNRSHRVEIDQADSLISRLGVMTGRRWNLSNGSVGEASFFINHLYQYTDGQQAHYSRDADVLDERWGNRDGWMNAGMNLSAMLNETVKVNLQTSYDWAGDVEDSWRIQGQVGVVF